MLSLVAVKRTEIGSNMPFFTFIPYAWHAASELVSLNIMSIEGCSCLSAAGWYGLLGPAVWLVSFSVGPSSDNTSVSAVIASVQCLSGFHSHSGR